MANDNVIPSLIDVEKTNKRYVVFKGIKYTHKEFRVMLKLMNKGLFVYPTKLSKENEEGVYETLKGFIITKALKEASSIEDPNIVFVTNDIDEVIDKAYSDKHHKSINVAFGNFNDKAIASVMNNVQSKDVFRQWIELMFESVTSNICGNCGLISNKLKNVTSTNNESGATSKLVICTGCYKRLGPKPIVNDSKSVGRNDKCMCGSGVKYKKCCGA